MSHYAKVLDGKVIQVIVANADFFNTFIDSSPGAWIETSYNTRGNVHYNSNTELPDGKPPLRGNFAGIGYIYDVANDVFYAPQPYPSWTLNTNTWLWEAPKPIPNDGNIYIWNEPTLSWIELEAKI
jgi:hypothetical protein